MEIKAKRKQDGDFIIEVGPVIFTLPEPAVAGLNRVITERTRQMSDTDKARTEKRLALYRNLADKLTTLEDPLIQTLLTQLSAEQMVTLARIAPSDGVYRKIESNLSRQNARQFEEDYARIKKISVHQASSQMEQIVPILKKTLQARKPI